MEADVRKGNDSNRLLRLILVVALICSGSASAQDKIEFYSVPTLPLKAESVHAYAVNFPDSLAADTLYQVRAANNYPVSYHRKVRTSVCFDNKCRLLDVTVHWNPTGRYLGFELPPGEYLSKTEHTPFTHDEYVRLHALLADANSPLGELSYHQLVPEKREVAPDLDAVSAPTAKHLLDFVVEGAAFTTYKLWHIIHGVTQEEIRRLTVELFSHELLESILRSPDVSDQIWALSRRHIVTATTPEIRGAILSFISSSEYSLAEGAINAIQPVDLEDADFQQSLVASIDVANYAMKQRIVEKFVEAPAITPQARMMLAEKLLQVSGSLLVTVLDLLKEKEITDMEVLRKVSTLLQHENVFISRQAFNFLSPLAIEDTEIRNALKQYKAGHDK